MRHELVGNTLNNTAKGIVARCTCGWSSGARASSLAASSAFTDHEAQAEADRSRRQALWSGRNPS